MNWNRLAAAALAALAASAASAQTGPTSLRDTGTPILFAPGVISTGDLEFAPAFEPDMKTVYFVKGSPGAKRVMWIVVSHLRGGKWSTPEIAPFSGQYSDIDPTLSPDGRKLFFASNRPTEGTAPRKDFDLWVVEKTEGGWSSPRNLGAPVNSAGSETTTSVTSDGTLYFASGAREANRPGRRLYRAKLVDGRYTTPEPLPPPIDGGEEDSNQYVAPDGRYLIFFSRRPGAAEPALFVSYAENGGWTAPETLSERLNADYAPYTPLVSPDGKSLYFTSQKGAFDHPPVGPMPYDKFEELMHAPGNGLADIYWIDLKALRLR
jgi:Tol biopolymer transport system component